MSKVTMETISMGSRIIALVGTLLLWQLSAFGQIGVPLTKSATIVLKGQRPLSQALLKVERLTHFPINLEDIPYQNANDLLTHDILTKYGTHFHAVGPRGGTLRVSLSQGQSACDAVQEVLSAYSGAGLPGTYTATCYPDRVNVFPTSFTDVNGDTRAAVPVMSEPISFPEAERPAGVVLQLIANALSQSASVKVILGTTPFPENVNITIGASKEPAESVIARMSAKLRPIAFWLGYDPGSKKYYLSIDLVPFAPMSSAGSAGQPAVAGPAAAQPKQNPWFTKSQ